MFGTSGIISSAISSAANMWSTHKTNQTNKSIANATNAMQMELANTAHQREVKDLQEAGLNPILSAGGQGAATPQLQSPTMQAPQFNFEGIMNTISAISASEKNEADARKTEIETALAPEIARAQIELQNAEGNLKKQQEIRERLENKLKEMEVHWNIKNPKLFGAKMMMQALAPLIDSTAGVVKTAANVYGAKKIGNAAKGFMKENKGLLKGDKRIYKDLYLEDLPTSGWNLGVY